MNKAVYLLLLAGIVISSCKTKPAAVSATDEDIQQAKIQRIDFNYFTAKTKVDYKDEDNDYHFTVNIRMKKDSIIWLSVFPLLGIEASRCIITNDSVFIVDRINNRYSAYDLSYISKQLSIPLSLPLLQSVIIGNMPFEQNLNEKYQKSDSSFFLLNQSRENIKAGNFILIKTMNLGKLEMRDLNTNNNMIVKYDNFAQQDNYNFPFSNQITIKFRDGDKSKTTNINISFNKAEFTDKQVNFPFNVPKRFENR
ncbi:MAG: DUF4292 domain-containing protein [Cytophagaceae bacterium]